MGKEQCQLELPIDTTQKTHRFPIKAIVLVAVSCIACTVCLLVGAFAAVPDTEVGTACVTSASPAVSESSQTLLVFAMGYLFCLVVKRRDDLAEQVDRMLRMVKVAILAMCSATSSRASSLASTIARSSHFQLPSWINRGAMGIITVVVLCTICITWLFVAAFTAEPGSEPTDDGLTSESSSTMRAFTVGWMFILSFKLRRELVGQVGPCCLLQPW